MNSKIPKISHGDRTGYKIEWRGIQLDILHTVKQYGDFDHIEIYSEERVPIPITETGYKSHFLPASHLEEYAGAVAYVQAWLNHEANKDAWEKYEAESLQLCLF
jgi:hypothetical protein